MLYITGKQATFLHDIKSLLKTMSDMDNPFMDTSGDLLALDTTVVADCRFHRKD